MNEYLERDLELEATAGRGTLRARVRERLPWHVRQRLRGLATRALEPRELLRARAIARSGRTLYLNLGSGEAPKRGWLNIDRPPSPADLFWDLRRRLPFAAGTARGVFLERVLEQFDLRGGHQIVSEAHRLLARGGILRIGVVDVRRYIESYAAGTPWIHQARPGRPTALVALQEVFYLYGHRAAYDAETLEAVCRSAGFVGFHVRSFGEGELVPCPDSEHRRENTLYVEAIR